MWYSNPQDADEDPVALPSDIENLKSTLLLTYSTINGVDTLYNNYKYSIAAKNYEIEPVSYTHLHWNHLFRQSMTMSIWIPKDLFLHALQM